MKMPSYFFPGPKSICSVKSLVHCNLDKPEPKRFEDKKLITKARNDEDTKSQWHLIS